ncbi:hypothetical protein [Lacipirellula sp.]|uniref:hypothetical protein n=1 Tax=Lacipirellula sp. TaxID=2691419 RepID=UPI003D0D7DED
MFLKLQAASLIAIVFVAGCSQATPEGKPLTGNVSFDGKPLASGYITFEPQSGQQTQAGATITAGKYATQANKEITPGLYAVAIVGDAELPPSDISPGTPEFEAAVAKLKNKALPKKYNVNSTLVAEVTAEGKNVFDFALTSK